MVTTEDVRDSLKKVFDPEIPVNIVDLGLIYDIKVDGNACKIRMTLTSQACPAAKELPDNVRNACAKVEGIDATGIDVEVVWEPQWGPHLISPEGRAILGFEDEEEDA